MDEPKNFYVKISVSLPTAGNVGNTMHHDDEHPVASSNPGLQLLLKVERLQAVQQMQKKSTGQVIA